MFTHLFTRGWTNGGGTLSKQITVQSGGEKNLDETIPGSTTDQLVDFDMDVSQMKGLFIVADQDCTIKTNSSGSPVNTITLLANVPFVWVAGDAALRDTGGAVITTDITKLYVTVGGATAALLQIRSLYDPTV